VDGDLASFLGTQETTSLEFKQSARDSSAILEVICAFANDLPRRGGGDLLIGVDKTGNPVSEVDTSDGALLRLTDMRDNGRILPRPSLLVSIEKYKSAEVIRVRVEASTSPPVRLDGVIWVRPGPTTRRATLEDERVLTERRRSLNGPYDSRPMEGLSVEDLDLRLFTSTYLPAVVAPDVIEENGRPLLQQLASLGLADSYGTPTLLGILIVGLNPSVAVPGAYMQFVRYVGGDVSDPVADEQEIRANLIEGATRLGAVIRGHLHTRVEPGDGFRDVDVPDCPVEAIREVCNAVMHRNCETSFAPVRIAWFDDRVEVTNPGGPFGQVRPDNFDRVNDYRNPNLASAMKSLGFVNRFGRGIGRIRRTLERNGNPAPEFIVDESSWVVVLRRVES
jgi:ATP-dependent DNA helicase RecG